MRGGERPEGRAVVIPADAGIHVAVVARSLDLWAPWIPTFVGMTRGAARRVLTGTPFLRHAARDVFRGLSNMVQARIYQRAKSSMQSGRARAGEWVLEFSPAEAKLPDPLTGWAGSGDTRGQVCLSFPTLDAAQAYATRESIAVEHIVPAAAKTLKLQAYADNFK